MTRKKKTRKTGPLAPSKAPKDKRQVENLTRGKKKGKGQPAGKRHSEPKRDQQTGQNNDTQTDPRKGSKRKIDLGPVVSTAAVAALTPQQALEQLQSDEKLQDLVERFEQGEVLSNDDQRYLDEQSERYEKLASQLGLDLDDDDDEWDDEEY
ncbi:Der GTPase-activating protein YihI [Idiomarina sp.]|uniref:Der GTPase-activating protein YihI n=1 Tax=Idiomarina sp. TaxID=1874361 RepID=UPI003512DFEA